jgi:hypothetical protein
MSLHQTVQVLYESYKLGSPACSSRTTEGEAANPDPPVACLGAWSKLRTAHDASIACIATLVNCCFRRYDYDIIMLYYSFLDRSRDAAFAAMGSVV